MARFVNGAICILAFGLSSSHWLGEQKPAAPKQPSRLNPVAPAVVQLLAVGPGDKGLNQECAATGFLVNGEGYILTNAHVVERARECLTASPGARIVAKPAQPHAGPNDTAKPDAAQISSMTAAVVSCDLVGLDDIHDLAVMKIERPFASGSASGGISYVSLDPKDVLVGTAVKVTGHPAFVWTAETQSGHIIGDKNLALFEHSAESSEVMVLDIPLKQGSSGSPVYLEEGGGVVGVVESRDTSNAMRTFAVPIRFAVELLNRLGVKWHAVQE